MVSFPLLLIPLAIYNIIVFLMPGVSLGASLVTLPLTSGAEWPVTLSDVLLTLGILMLLLEVIKGARPGAKYLTDHLLSLIVFGGAAAEFLLVPRFANSTYFLLVLLTLTEFLAGVSLRVRRAPAISGASRGMPRATTEVTHEQGDAAAWPPAGEPAKPAPSEPTFDHREADKVAAPAPIVEHPAVEHPAESQAGSGLAPPPETSHQQTRD
jgi:hypothetical protein